MLPILAALLSSVKLGGQTEQPPGGGMLDLTSLMNPQPQGGTQPPQLGQMNMGSILDLFKKKPQTDPMHTL